MTRERNNNALDAVAAMLEAEDDILIATVFGSVATGSGTRDSDLDIAVMADRPLGAERRSSLIRRLAEICGRPVDLVDLRTAGIVIMRTALIDGRLLLCKDKAEYAELLYRMLIDSADFLPYRERLLEERRLSWIGR